jgi:tRNA/rRNA methyltransferase
MRQIRVVCIEPKYQVNLGYVARVMKNFGIEDLALVRPRCKHTGKNAVKYSKHAHELLRNARIYKNLEKAARGITIGTTGIWEKSDRTFNNIYSLSELRNMKGWAKSRYVTVVLGRDDTGLNRDELAACDAIVFIGSSKSYPVLNISHALAIVLYELTMPGFSKEYRFARFRSDEADQKRLATLFDMMVRKRGNIRDKRAVSAAFRRVVRRAMPTRKEINAISVGMSPWKNSGKTESE